MPNRRRGRKLPATRDDPDEGTAAQREALAAQREAPAAQREAPAAQREALAAQGEAPERVNLGGGGGVLSGSI